MDVLPLISDFFNIYFPMCMLIFCLCTWYSLGSRILNALGFQQFMANETISSELVQEGKDLLMREKRKRQRTENTLARRRELQTVRDTSNNSNFAFRPNKNSNDGLLRDGGTVVYNTNTADPTDINRSLSQEINDRFGKSTNVGVGFRPNAVGSDDSDDDFASSSVHPKNIFGDV